MPGPKSFREVHLSDEQSEELQSLTRSTTAPTGKTRRADIVLRAARGERIRVIAREVGVRRDVVRKWIDRFIAEGMAGLDDLPRPGRPRHSPLASDATDPESYNHKVPELPTERFDWSKLNPLRRAEVERALQLLGLIGLGPGVAHIAGAAAVSTTG